MTAVSALYVGRLSHARLRPKPYAFSQPLQLFYLDLAELSKLPPSLLWGVERARPLSFRRKDYLGDAGVPLRQAVLDTVERDLGRRPTGPVRMLTLVRWLGYAFNPVTFYYCFDAGETLAAVVAEITNTPWLERHAYVLPATAGGVSASFDKAFHVSPFFGMSQRYTWKLGVPGEALELEMVSEEAGQEVFRAGLTLERQSLDTRGLLAAIWRQPLFTWTAHLGIYWHAFRLWSKGSTFFPHPPKAP